MLTTKITSSKSINLKPKSVGPRAEKRQKELHELAVAKAKLEADNLGKQSDEVRVWESTTSEAQKLAKSRILVPSCIDKGHSIAALWPLSKNDEDILSKKLYHEEAITHWSENHKGGPQNFPATVTLSSTSPSARCSALRKDVEDF